jgi:chemotaxis protein MotB
MYAAALPPPPAPVRKEGVDCEAVSRDLKNKCPNLEIRVMERSNGDCVISLDRVLFDTGKADIREEGRPVLEAIADILKDNPNYSVRIKGHTDSRPIRGRLKKRFPSNWELSRARADAVYHYFLEKGQISGQRMNREGFADSQPAASNKTPEGRQSNRRTEIILYVGTPLKQEK